MKEFWQNLSLLGGVIVSIPFSWAAGPSTEIRIAAAADLKFAMADLIQEYRNEHQDHQMTPIYGSSGSFVSQIEQGAPFDLFFSADTGYAQALVKSPRVGGEIFSYAIGHLVLWIPQDSKLSIEKGLSILTSPEVKKIAIANPVHAPYGKAAEAALKNAKIYNQVSSKLVLGTDISQAAQFVQSRAADIGLLAQSLAESPYLKNHGNWLAIPESLYPKMNQSGVVLKPGAHQKEARSFRNFVLSAKGREILSRSGLTPATHSSTDELR